MKDLCVLILAAGKGTRMKSNRAKVLHEVCGKPMIRMVYSAAAGIDPEQILVVIGQDAAQVRASLAGLPAEFAHQEEQLGTGHAVIAARDLLAHRRGDVVILFGDSPRVRAQTLRSLVERHRTSGSAATLLTCVTEIPSGYGRIIRNDRNEFVSIVEEKDCNAEQKRITEINIGFYCFQVPSLLDALGELKNNNAQKEYYMTDLPEIILRHGRKVTTVRHSNFDELRGVNSRRELAEISKVLRADHNHELMESGVTMIDPERTYVDLEVVIEKDVTIYPMVILEGNTRIGEGSIIHAGSRIVNSTIGQDVEILGSCLITDSIVGRGSVIGPCAHLRDHAEIGESCRIGNFVEIKKSTLGNGSKAAHLAYLGNATIGKNVNIGAGTITCNYDGSRKHSTIIEDNAFIGSDSQLVAPVSVGRGAYVAAGSTITEDVPAGALGISRGRQEIKLDWVQKRADRKRNR